MITISKKSFAEYFKRSWKEYAVIVFVLFVDLLSKFLIDKNLELNGEAKTIIKNFLSFEYTNNKYSAFSFDFFGLATSNTFYLIVIPIAMLLFFGILIWSHKRLFLMRLSVAMMIGGGLGNLYDRIFNEGLVRDFIRFDYFGGTLFGEKHFAIFNLADSALVVGVILFAIYVIFYYTKDETRINQLEKSSCTSEENQKEIASECEKIEEIEAKDENQNNTQEHKTGKTEEKESNCEN
jgi:signal peptidase II